MKDGRIHTPVPDCFLDGITRRTVIALARSLGHEVVERQIRPEELADATECFLTGTAAEVTPGGSIADRSEEHTSELQSLMRISYAVFCLKKTKGQTQTHN